MKEQLLSSLSAPHSCDSPALFMAPDRLFHADVYLEVYCQSIIDPSTVVLRVQGRGTLDQSEHQVPSNFGVCILRARTYDELTYDVIIARSGNIIVNVGELELTRSSFVLRNGIVFVKNVCSSFNN